MSKDQPYADLSARGYQLFFQDELGKCSSSDRRMTNRNTNDAASLRLAAPPGRSKISETRSSCKTHVSVRISVFLVICYGIALATAAHKNNGNGQNPIDLEDEEDIGNSLTFPGSEEVLVLPEVDDKRDDEDKREQDTQEDLEDLVDKRILPVVDVIESDSSPKIDDSLVTTKSQAFSDSSLNAPSVPTAAEPVDEDDDDDDDDDDEVEIGMDNQSTEDEVDVSPTVSMTEILTSRRTARLVTISPRFRHTVLPIPEDLGLPPIITKNPLQEISYPVGGSFVLECNASGNPEYTWKRDGEAMSKSNSSGYLVYDKTNESLGGNYQCFARNSFGTAVSTVARVTKAELLPFPSRERRIHRPLVGQSLTLHCDPPVCNPKGFVYWSEAGSDSKLKAIDNSPRVSLDYDGNLHFANIEMEDSRRDTNYICTVFNNVLRSLVQGDDQLIQPVAVEGSPVSRSPLLMWSSPSGTKLVVVKGRQLKMKCFFSGYPTPTVNWERIDDGEPSRMTIPSDSFGQEMVIKSVTLEDTGLYRCIAHNGESAAAVSKTFTVDVESAPYWRNDETPQNVEVSEDDGASFMCVADGYPKPKITWSVNGVPSDKLPADARRKVNATHLTYVDLTASDTQVVQCLAENVHGSLLANAYLVVKASAPLLIEFLDPEEKITVGRDVILDCEAIGDPKPVITWTKDNASIHSLDGQYVIHRNGSLEILDVELEDDKVYKCTAHNKFGVDSASGHLIVREQTKIVVPPKSQQVVAPSHLTLQCSVETDPFEFANLKVVWLKDGNPMLGTVRTDRVFHNPSDNSLLIRNSQVEDTANYTCEASNGLDDAKFGAEVIIKDRPDAPVDLHLTSCSGSNTTLTWKPGDDNNDPVTEYLIYRETSPTNESETIKITDADSLEAVISLRPWRSYKFYVAARNSIGLSERSALPVEPCRTPPSTPLKNPDGVCSEMRGFKRLVIIWKPLTFDELNGPGFRYVITYKRRDVQKPVQEERLAITDWQAKELVIYDLEEFKPYEIYVQSVNDVGPASDEIEHRIAYSSEGTPIISPQNFRINDETLTSMKVEFQWDAVDEDSELIKGFFKGYQVQYWKEGEKESVRTVDVIAKLEHDLCPLVKNRKRRSPDSRARVIVSALAADLWPFSQITAGVAVVNHAKVGNLSKTITFHTPEGVPGPVTNLRLAEVGSFHVRLRWDTPLNPNGIITGYVVQYRLASNLSGPVKEKFIKNPFDLLVKLSPLSPNSSYLFYVYATTSVGNGEADDLEAKTLLSGPPDKPLITGYDVSESSVNISWLPSEKKVPENPGSDFYVEYRKEAEADDWQKANPADDDDQWVNVTDLETGAPYVFTVVAVNLVNRTKSDEVRLIAGVQPEILPGQAVASSNWLVPLIVAIALLLLLVIILLIVCCFRNKGGDYPVVKKEQQLGKAVQEEEKEFGEYFRKPDSNHVQSRSSLISDVSSAFSEEDLSLEEYEDPETLKFNEDGSFIGRYGTKGQRNGPVYPTNVLNTFV